ncbi:TfoX/Sxy family DNA transformation protein [Pseudooceanicola sp. C21-150M6]|uniref:TfoX/Sxy family DNA transformation protein n=1 Tax=Pseudooceanicola sp. C21-150M6 TaxID=3434355 RepID=UPI003D7FD496
MSEEVTAIRNVGPAMAAEMQRAGFADAEAVRAAGADVVYAAMVRAGTRPHFIGFYALVMGLQGRPWNDLRGEEKVQMRVRFDALVAGSQGGTPDSALERVLNEIGTGRRR